MSGKRDSSRKLNDGSDRVCMREKEKILRQRKNAAIQRELFCIIQRNFDFNYRVLNSNSNKKNRSARDNVFLINFLIKISASLSFATNYSLLDFSHFLNNISKCVCVCVCLVIQVLKFFLNGSSRGEM